MKVIRHDISIMDYFNRSMKDLQIYEENHPAEYGLGPVTYLRICNPQAPRATSFYTRFWGAVDFRERGVDILFNLNSECWEQYKDELVKVIQHYEITTGLTTRIKVMPDLDRSKW